MLTGVARRSAAALATPSSTPPLTTTPVSPTPKCSPTNAPKPPPLSCSGRAPGSSLGVAIRTVYTDNGAAYRSRLFQATCRSVGIRSKRTRPYRPQTNGKVERFHRTSGPTSASISLKPSAQLLSDLGCICIITTVVTPQSEVSRPSPVSTTSLDTTARPQRKEEAVATSAAASLVVQVCGPFVVFARLSYGVGLGRPCRSGVAGTLPLRTDRTMSSRISCRPECPPPTCAGRWTQVPTGCHSLRSSDRCRAGADSPRWTIRRTAGRIRNLHQTHRAWTAVPGVEAATAEGALKVGFLGRAGRLVLERSTVW